MADALTPDLLAGALETNGWVVAPGIVNPDMLEVLKRELDASLRLRQEIRRRNRVEENNDGTLHHLLADHVCFLDLLSTIERFDTLLKWYFSGNFILNSYGGVINRRDTRAYVHHVHRDIRFSSKDRRFMLNILVMLDDFTLENGATHLLSGSQELSDKPDEEIFLSTSSRATGSRGSVLFFDSRLWHATGQNLTDEPRRALTLTFTSPFFKQQLDYPRLMGYGKINSLNSFLRQVIGFNSRVPTVLDEYYVAVSERFYQRGQDD